MTQEKLITFAVPCYNSAAYMDHCVETLLQGGDDIEIILVDDGSTKDNTAEICDRYAQQYPDIVRAIHQPNGGHGEGINSGLARAKGLYFKVIDSDDWADLNALNRVVNTLLYLERDGGVDVLMKDQPSIHADMVVMAIGVTPESSLAKNAGLALGMKGSILVNDRMETSVPDIYAVGDAVQVKHSVTGEDALIALAGPANKQGRIAADNICGGDSRYPGSQGSSVIKVFDMTAATTGINETNARKSGLDVDTVILSPMSHAGYYPGGKVMTMKVVFEKGTYRLLGAQIVGYDGVDKRIDVLATAIHAGMKATELKDLDLAYAPPYSSAKDPVNMAGFMIDNISKGLKQWHLADADKLPRDGSVTLLDTRTPGEYSRGHIDGFKNIPVDELRERISEIEAGKKIYVICQSGLRSYIATRILEGYGFEAYNFAGGFRFYDAVMNDRALVEKAYSCGMDK